MSTLGIIEGIFVAGRRFECRIYV